MALPEDQGSAIGAPPLGNIQTELAAAADEPISLPAPLLVVATMAIPSNHPGTGIAAATGNIQTLVANPYGIAIKTKTLVIPAVTIP